MGEISFNIEPETGIAIATCSGIFKPKEAIAGVSTLWNNPDWPGKAVVWDFRDANFALSSTDVRQIAKYVLNNQPNTPPLKVAFVTNREVDFGMARMFGIFREDSRTSFNVFRDYDEAIEWAKQTELEDQ